MEGQARRRSIMLIDQGRNVELGNGEMCFGQTLNRWFTSPESTPQRINAPHPSLQLASFLYGKGTPCDPLRLTKKTCKAPRLLLHFDMVRCVRECCSCGKILKAL